MKEVTPEKLDITDNTSEEEDLTPKSSAKTSQAKGTKTKKKTISSENDVMDALEKVRAEEKAKLEALQNREREKTRLAVEKERAKLEAELEKEIKALEAQLAKDRARVEQTAEATSERIQLVEVKTETAKPEVKEKVAAAKTKTASKTAKTKIASKTKKVKKATPKTEIAAKNAVEKGAVQTAIGPINLKPLEEENLTPIPEMTPALSKGTEEIVTEKNADVITQIPEVSQEEAIDASNAQTGLEAVITDQAKFEEVKPEVVSDEVEPIVSEEIIPEEISVKTNIVPETKIPEILAKSEDKPSPIASASDKTIGQEDTEASTVINSLEKLREKIYAQKQLERELMEKEASKIQEKDRMLLDKIQLFDEETAVDETDDIKAAQDKIESLVSESEEQMRRIGELESIINKVKALKIDNINVIDQNTFEISNDFLALTAQTIDVNKVISEIEKELENLTLEHNKTIEKLYESETINRRLQESYQLQIVKLESERHANQQEISKLQSQVLDKEKLYIRQINNLNEVILRTEEKLNQEKDSQQGYLTKIETLQYEKMKLETEVSELESEIKVIKDKLQKRFDSSINAAARIDALEAEKTLLENKIVQLSKQLIMKERGLSDEVKTEGPYDHILSEIERLKEEVRSLATNQKPFGQAYPDSFGYFHPKPEAHESNNCPYVRFFNPVMVPNTSYNPTVLNEDLVQEIRNLKQEFQEFKQGKSRFDEGKNSLKIEENKPEFSSLLEEHSNQIKEYQEELEKSKAELSLVIERNNQEIERLSQSYESQIQAKDNEKNMIKVEQERKIQELQDKIQEKDAMLEKINDEVKRLTEDDIFDPEFKRKIRVIREMRRESEESAEREEQEYLNNVKTLKEKIDAKNMEIDVINDKVFQLELNYKQNRDFSSATQEEYEKTKSKLLIERQLQEERRRSLEDDLTRVNFKYQSYLDTYGAEIEKLNKQEAETIEFFLNKLRRAKVKNIEGLRDTEGERDELARQLEKVKEDSEEQESSNPDEIEVEMPFTRQKERHGNNDLENEIRELTRHYNEYYRQITELKAEQDKRIEVEKRLRANEKTVYDYCTCKVNMDECLKSYQEKSRMIEDKQQELSKTANRQEDRTSQLKFKAEIQDLDVHRNDLRAKIEFYRKQLSDLEKEEIVQNYKALLSQMEKIRNVLREKREQAEAIKVQVQAKTKELEALRG